MPAAALQPPRGVAKMYQQQQPTTTDTVTASPPPIPSLDAQERDRIGREVQAMEQQSQSCRREIDGVLENLCKTQGGRSS